MNLGRTARTAALTTGCLLISGAATSVEASTPRPPSYTMIDVGTFGGPHADLDGRAVQIPRRGTILGTADTAVADPDFPNVKSILRRSESVCHARVPVAAWTAAGFGRATWDQQQRGIRGQRTWRWRRYLGDRCP